MGPCQPRNHVFPFREFGGKSRRFVPAWFDEHESQLEYSIAKDEVFCLCCYLFKTDNGEQGGGNTFVSEGFSNWNEKKRLQVHVGSQNSIHNNAMRKCQALMNEKQHVGFAMNKKPDDARYKYWARLEASVACIRFLLCQGLAFREHDEFEESRNKGQILQLLEFRASRDESIREFVLKNAPENDEMISPRIQKDIVNAVASETTNAIIRDLESGLFSILVDESRDVSVKEQMAIVLRYVDKSGQVIEHYLSIVHVMDTTALKLKEATDSLFSKHGLYIASLHGQGYDGASNMRGEYNGLKSLIIKENGCAFYVHCFAHQLQLTLVAVAQRHSHVASLFNLVAKVTNVVGGLCKSRIAPAQRLYPPIPQFY